MEPRFNLFDSPTAAKVAKRFYNTSSALEGSTLPRPCGNWWSCGSARSTAAASASTSTRRRPRPPVRPRSGSSLLAAWRHSTVFTEAERAALALAEEGTRLGDGGVSDETWAEVRKHYDDDQVGALVCLVSLINAATRMNVIVHNPGVLYEPGMFAGMSS